MRYLLNILGMRAHRPEGFLEKLVVPLKPHRTARGACVGTFPLFFEKIQPKPNFAGIRRQIVVFVSKGNL
jgi:hypothetical protein